MKQTLNIDELKALMQKAFNAGVSVGKKMKPIDQIPMGSKIQTSGKSFEIFFDNLVNELNNQPPQ